VVEAQSWDRVIVRFEADLIQAAGLPSSASEPGLA